jgi:hypothetical protein
MKKTDEYIQHANDCRKLAKQMDAGEQHDQLIKMAETWEVLARERERTLRNRGSENTLEDESPIAV